MLILKAGRLKFNQLLFTRDGAGLIAAGGWGLQHWQSLARTSQRRLISSYVSRSIALDATGTVLFATDDHNGLRAFHLQEDRPADSISPQRYNHLAASKRDRIVAATSRLGVSGFRTQPDGTIVHLWFAKGSISDSSCAAFFEDGSLLQFEFNRRWSYGEQVRLTVRDAGTGRVIREHLRSGIFAYPLLLTPDERSLAGFFQNTIGIHAMESDRTSLLENDSRQHFTGIAFHPSGRWLAATSNDTTVKLYDTSTWQLAKSYAWNIGRLRSIAFSPDGMLAAAGSDTGRIVVWDVED